MLKHKELFLELMDTDEPDRVIEIIKESIQLWREGQSPPMVKAIQNFIIAPLDEYLEADAELHHQKVKIALELGIGVPISKHIEAGVRFSYAAEDLICKLRENQSNKVEEYQIEISNLLDSWKNFQLKLGAGSFIPDTHEMALKWRKQLNYCSEGGKEKSERFAQKIELWQKLASEIWEATPNLKIREVSRRIEEKTGDPFETIRKKIKKR